MLNEVHIWFNISLLAGDYYPTATGDVEEQIAHYTEEEMAKFDSGPCWIGKNF